MECKKVLKLFKMASDKKFVRLKHDQLVQLAEEYDQKKESTHRTDAQGKKVPSEKKRQGKKPEIQYYRPGVSRLRRKPGESENADADQHEQGPETAGFQQESAPEPVYQPQAQAQQKGPREELAEQMETKMTISPHSRSAGAPTRSQTTQQKKPRHKRPDLQIYVPKPKQQHQFDEQHVVKDNVVPLRELDEQAIEQVVEGEVSDRAASSATQRLVNVSNSDDAPLRVTLINQSPSQEDRDTDENRGGRRQFSRGQKQNKGDRSKNSPDSKSRYLNVSSPGDHGQFSDHSHDSLEWDYQVEMEMAHGKYESQQHFDQVDEEVLYHPAFDDEDMAVSLGEPHSPTDKKRKWRNNKKDRSNTKPPFEEKRESHQQQGPTDGGDRKQQQKPKQQSRDSHLREPRHQEERSSPRKDFDEETEYSKARKSDQSKGGGDKKRHDSGEQRPASKPRGTQNQKGPVKNEPLDSTQQRVQDQLIDGTFQGLVFTNSKFDRRSEHSGKAQSQHRSESPEEQPRPSRGKQQQKTRNKKTESGRNERQDYGRRDQGREEEDVHPDEGRRNLKVHFAQNDGRHRLNSKDGSSAEEPPSPDSGHHGLIKLPVRQQTEAHAGKPHSSPVPARGARGRGRGTSRGGSHRVLYDPSNPKKHLQAQQSTGPQLHFRDPSEPVDFSPDPYSMSGGPYFYDMQPYDMKHTEYSGSPQARGDGFYHQYNPAYCESTALNDDTYSRDPYYHGETEQDLARGGHSRAANKSKAEAILREVTPLDSQLGNILSRGVYGQEGLHKVMSLRREVQNKFEQVILLDPDLANKHNVEQVLWKSVYYQVIELFRKHLLQEAEKQQQQSETVKNRLLALLDEGMTFYEGLLKNLQTTNSFVLEDFMDPHQLPPENISRAVKLALLSAQRCMICLGDIARYREQANQTSNYGKARSWYMKSQQIAPKNGRPYNQLAILALYTRRKLDAVYYYMRSLAASNPFLTARESLMSLFDEARKKAIATEQKKVMEQAARANAKRTERRRRTSSESGHRVEVWVSPDGSTSEDQINDDEEGGDLMKMPSGDLNKKFIVSYMNVHGKLFTKIGMETFPEMWAQMLTEFLALIGHTPAPVGNNRLLQLMAVNMFAIENVLNRESQSNIEDNCRSLLQEQAVQLGLDMFGLLVQRCTALFEQHLQSGDCQVMNEDLHQFFPSVKVWSDWMMCHVDLWNPPPLTRDPDMGPNVDVWQCVADLCNILKEVEISHVKIYSQKKEGCDPILLGEDTMMGGFVPLLSLPQLTSYVHSTVDKDVARDCLRVEKLKTFGDYLCGIEPPLLSYNVETYQYVSIAPELIPSESEPEQSGDNDLSRDDDEVILESDSEEADLNTSGEDDHIRHLKAKKQELERRMAEKARYEESVKATLEGKQNRPITLEIHPQFLVPDTNCFIDHQVELRKLLASRKFTIVVPLVVINELDGLAKGSRAGQYENRDHAAMVKAETRSAIQFLEDEFEARNSRLRALTSKGSVLDTIAFRSEESNAEGNNDDLILSCCLHYCKDKARDFMPKAKDEPIRLQREVVLLTDDRNLRLKAHMRNVPVKDIPAFLGWARIT